jgi:hypothetical protein
MPKGLRSLVFSFDGTGLTRYGGMVLFHRFCKQLGLRRALQRHMLWPYVGREYAPVDLLLAQLFSIVAGLGRIENVRALKWNGLLPALLGMKSFPHPVTLRRFLHHWTPVHLSHLQTAHDQFRRFVWTSILPLYSAILDADTTVLTVYGNHEGAVLGYNPTHRGRKSFAPLLLFESRSGLSLAAEWRSGNVHSSTGVVPMLRHSLTVLPSTVAANRIRFRADNAFYDGQFIQFLDEKRMGYTIVARMTHTLRQELERIRFRPFRPGYSIGALKYQPYAWRKPMTVVSTRRDLRTLPDPHQPDLLVSKRHGYHAVATNLGMSPENIMHFYNSRAQQELIFRELKNDSTLACIPTRRFHANAFYLELILWAYDLVTLFQRTCLNSSCQDWTLHTIQREIWGLPALLLHTHNKNLLRLPPNFPHQDIFALAQRRLRSIQPWL